MKKHLLQLLVLFLVSSSISLFAQGNPQEKVIDDFEASAANNVYQLNKEGATVFTVTDVADAKVGTKALKQYASVPAGIHSWGSYAQLIRTRKVGEPFMNWEGSDSISLWLKVVKAPSKPENIVFRIHIGDRVDTAGTLEEYIYENATVLDAVNGWVNLRIPLVQVESDGSVNPSEKGFVIMPSSWNGGRNDSKLDFTKIAQYNISFITTNDMADSIEVIYDHFTRFGMKKVPFVVFNGKAVSGEMKMGAWGNSTSAAVTPGAGSVAGKAAIKWIVDPQSWDGGKTGWCGITFDFTEKNMGGNWVANDTMKLRVKIPAAFNDDLRISFNGGTGNCKYIFKKSVYNWDDTWKTLKMPLFGGQPDGGKVGFDSTKVNKFEILDETGSAKACTIYIEDVWMGSPVFDVIAPIAVTNLAVTGTTQYQNIITWKDVPNETNAKYDVYYSATPITAIDQKGIEVVATGVPENTMTVSHVLRAPNTDQNVSYYYAVVCTDAAGNVGPFAAKTTATATKAKGVPTIALAPPANFTVNGTLTEWTTAGIKPIAIKSSDGTGTIVPNTKIDGDADLSVLSYLAVDKDNLYFAFDVTDDQVYGDTTASANRYELDCPDLFIGLYDFHGAYHKSLARGVTPDYHFRFNKDKCYFDGQSSDFLIMPGANYVWKEKLSGGYTVEGKISWKDIATKRNSNYTGVLDNLFVPVEGMRIPIDFSVNDNDNGKSREGILCYSPANNDNSYQDVTRWTYTWIGNKMFVTGVEQISNGVVSSYELSQNYPNPFNPTTNIRYAITKTGMVSLKVYDVVGREVATLVNQEQGQGSYQVSFDASMLSSGIYFYRLQSGEFTATNKMMLIK